MRAKKPLILKSLLIFEVNVWFLNMNVMNSSRAYKKGECLNQKSVSCIFRVFSLFCFVGLIRKNKNSRF
ncbi:hypothetical protein Glove_212g142 [Diversispora epigaea]|uniref:Uncharacterized protein n=1 Tax=Diversispora epigaea TaxID=1348612 RepID=A0A397II20_9GLOM|nr:hypothetical protein Glove_212g142 [Diversispora epigaea]